MLLLWIQEQTSNDHCRERGNVEFNVVKLRETAVFLARNEKMGKKKGKEQEAPSKDEVLIRY